MEITNNHGLPEPVYQAIRKDEYDAAGDISITGLIDAPQVKVLTKRHSKELEVDAMEMVWSLLGSAVHAIVERTIYGNDTYLIRTKIEALTAVIHSAQTKLANPAFDFARTTIVNFLTEEIKGIQAGLERVKLSDKEYLSEKRLFIDVNGWKISAKPDLYELGAEILYDYKVTSVWSIIKKDNWRWDAQTNCYAEILRQHGYSPKKIFIVAILKDYSESQKRVNQDYPEHPIVMYPIKMYSSATMQDYMLKRVVMHQQALTMPSPELPECTEKDKWTTPTTWAAMKEGAARAVRVFEDEGEAQQYMVDNHSKNMYLETRKGSNIRCEKFCPVNRFCFQRKREHS